jgi:hypothetical protein
MVICIALPTNHDESNGDGRAWLICCQRRIGGNALDQGMTRRDQLIQHAIAVDRSACTGGCREVIARDHSWHSTPLPITDSNTVAVLP